MAEFAEPSVVDIGETELTRWLFSQWHFAALLSDELGLPGSSRVLLSVDTKHVVPDARGPGDVDVLVAALARPEIATAIEVKRIKISEKTFVTKAPTKLASCARGVRQANVLGKIGFHRTWLFVVVATDGRQRPSGNFFSRGVSSELMDTVSRHPAFDDLDPHIGLIFGYLDQPVDKPITLAGGFSLNAQRKPTNMVQPYAVTVGVQALLA